MLATIRDDECAQHAAHNPRFEKMGLFRRGHKKIKGPAHMVEGGHHLRKAPNPHPHYSTWMYRQVSNIRRTLVGN